MHNALKQAGYRGEMGELTEAVSHLPAGGQVLLTNALGQNTAGHLHQIQLITLMCFALRAGADCDKTNGLLRQDGRVNKGSLASASRSNTVVTVHT